MSNESDSSVGDQMRQPRGGRLVGYARVYASQIPAQPQVDALTDAGCVQIYVDVARGAKQARPQWDQCLASLRPGDTLLTCTVDRVGRSFSDLAHIFRRLSDRHIAFRSIEDPVFDTSTQLGWLIIRTVTAMADYQTSLISERTTPGLGAVRQRGRLGGRRPKMTPELILRAQRMYDSGQYSARHIAEVCGVSRETIYRHIRATSQSQPYESDQ